MLLVARIGRAHGLRGEVTVQVHTDSPDERFVPGAELATDPADAGPLVVRGVRVHQGRYLLAFEGVTDRTGAESLRGTRLLAEELDEDEDEDEGWYEEELLGLRVVDTAGAVLGEVSGLHTREVQDLLEVRLTGGGTALVPFVEELVPEVDEEQGRVVVDLPEGLLELGE